MIKRYKLLKDLPDVEAGVLFTHYASEWAYKDDNNSIMISEDIAENTPEWFTPYMFTTDDGIDMYKGDIVYGVDEKRLVFVFTALYGEQDNVDYARFSTESAAESYIELLKPKYKVGDIVVHTYQDTGYTQIFEVTSISNNKFNNIYLTKHCRKAIDKEVIQYYESKGWVKGAKFKYNNNIHIINNLELLSNKLTIITTNNSIYNDINNCELVKDEYPKSWEELKLIEGYFINTDCSISKSGDCQTIFSKHKDIYVAKNQAKSSLAFAQLSQLHNRMIEIYNEVNDFKWVADWGNFSEKWCIIRRGNSLEVISDYNYHQHLAFPCKKLAEFSLLHHKELWEQYYEL